MAYMKFKFFLMTHNIKQDEPANLLHTSTSNFNHKLNCKGSSDFTNKEVNILCKAYNLSADEYFSIE